MASHNLNEKDVAVEQGQPFNYNGEEKRKGSISNALGGVDDRAIEGQMFSMNDIDPALDAKMRLVNNVRRR